MCIRDRTNDVIRLYDVIYINASQLSYIMGPYHKHRSVTEHQTEVSPIGYQALTYKTNLRTRKLRCCGNLAMPPAVVYPHSLFRLESLDDPFEADR